MPDEEVSATMGPPEGAAFATTLWSTVLAAGKEERATEAFAALEKLCGAYWRPLYSFLRRQGKSPHDAEDLTQGFFAFILERRALSEVRRERGKFRTFLLASLKNYVSDQWDRNRAQKRGGGGTVISLEADQEEARLQLEPVDNLTPEKLFDRRWALTLLENATLHLAAEYRSRGKQKLYEEIHGFLLDRKSDRTQAEVARRLGVKESTIGVEVLRMRGRFRELCRQEIAETVGSLDEVTDEMNHLFAALQA